MSYISESGDTFEIISRKFYGLETDAWLIRAANPDVSDVFIAGTVIFVPEKEINPIIPSGAASNDSFLFVDNKILSRWSNITYTKKIDSFSSVQFSSPFDPANKDHRDTFRPFLFQNVIYAIGDEFRFFGVMLSPSPSLSGDSSIVSVSAYSRAARLNDCSFPVGSELQFDNQKLEDIADSLCRSLGLTPVFIGDTGAPFERVAAEPEEIALQFLSGLARQRGFIISDNEDGQPVFYKSITEGVPVAIFREGDPSVSSIVAQFNSQQYYSHITAIASTSLSDEGSRYTVKNTKLTEAHRPHTFKPNDSTSSNAQSAAEAKMGRMFGAAVSYTVTVPSWRNPKGELWDVNTLVAVLAPNAMVYNQTTMIVKEVVFSRSDNSEAAVLTLVLVGSYSGQIPEVLPWED